MRLAVFGRILLRALRARPGCGGPRRHPVEQRDHILDLGAIEALGDEDDLAAMVGIRPAFEPRQIVQEVLRALDHGRPAGFLGDIHDALHPQQVGTEILLQGVEQKAQSLARNRCLAHEAERGDIAIVEVMVVVIMVVIMIVRMAVCMIVIVVVLLLIGGGIEPGACIGLGVGRIEALGAQQRTDIECRIVDPRNLGGRIEPPQPRDQRRLGLFRMRLFQQIALGDEDMIGQRDLAHRLDVIVERPRAVYGIDRRDDGADAIQPGQRRVRQKAWISGDGSASPDVSMTT